jgi:predicted RNA methylase
LAADYKLMLRKLMIRNLLSFYDFNGKTVVAVGAGGGLLAEYGRAMEKVIAVDHDPAALKQLHENLLRMGLADKFTLVQSDFFRFDIRADVLLFEFCLHEISDPAAAIAKARTLAPDVVVFDHALDSAWAYCVAEEDKVRLVWRILDELPLRQRRQYETVHKFSDFSELLEKVKSQGETAIQRIEKWRGQKNIVIPMTYGLALL